MRKLSLCVGLALAMSFAAWADAPGTVKLGKNGPDISDAALIQIMEYWDTGLIPLYGNLLHEFAPRFDNNGNTIPDGYEMALLEAVLSDVDAPGHDVAHDAYKANLALIRANAPTVSSLAPSTECVLAAYFTLGDGTYTDNGKTGKNRELASALGSIGYVAMKYDDLGDVTNWATGGPILSAIDTSAKGLFGPLGDYDGDGVPNINEWNAAPDRATYLANAMDPAVKNDGGNWALGGTAMPVYFFNKANGHVYGYIKAEKTWLQSQEAATGATVDTVTGAVGHMVTISDEAEWLFVRGIAQLQNSKFALGLYDANGEADGFEWTWVDGTPYDFTAWDDKEPNGPKTEPHGEMKASGKASGKWNDNNNPTYQYYMVEFDGPFTDADGDGIPDGWENVDQGEMPAEGEGEGEGEEPPAPCEFLDVYAGQFEIFADAVLDIDVAKDVTIADLLAANANQTGLANYDLENLYKFLTQTGLPGDGLPDLVQMKMVEYVLCHPEHPLNASVVAGLAANKKLFVDGCFALVEVLQGQLEALQGQLAGLDPENPDHQPLIEEAEAGIEQLEDFMEILIGLSAMMPDYVAASVGTSDTMRTSWDMLFQVLTGGALQMPAVPPATIADYVVFKAASKAGDEPFSATGDLDGDGLTNAEEYAAVAAVYSDAAVAAEIAAIAISDPYNFWPGNPELPVGGMVGLGLLAGALVLGGRLVIRKK